MNPLRAMNYGRGPDSFSFLFHRLRLPMQLKEHTKFYLLPPPLFLNTSIVVMLGNIFLFKSFSFLPPPHLVSYFGNDHPPGRKRLGAHQHIFAAYIPDLSKKVPDKVIRASTQRVAVVS